jgi:hypothetical protein
MEKLSKAMKREMQRMAFQKRQKIEQLNKGIEPDIKIGKLGERPSWIPTKEQEVLLNKCLKKNRQIIKGVKLIAVSKEIIGKIEDEEQRCNNGKTI